MTAPEQLVRSILLGVVFGDSELLGECVERVERQLYRLGEPDMVQRVYDRIATVRLPNSVGTSLRGVLDDLADRYDGRSTDLILDTVESSDSWMFSAPPVFPAFVFHDVAPDCGLGPTPTNLTDNHLHSGASISVTRLSQLLVASDLAFQMDAPQGDNRTLNQRLLGVWGTDAWGKAFSLPVVAGALRCFLARRLDPDHWSEGKGRCLELWARRTFWSEIGCAARTFAVEDELTDELFSGFGGVRDADPVAAIRDLVRDATEHPTEETLTDVYGVLGCLSLLHCSLSSRSGEGLGRFVDRFDRMGLLRDLAAGPEKAALVTAACESVFTDRRVLGAEFRKTIVSHDKGVAACVRSIRSSLEGHAKGFVQYLSISDRALRLSVPMGFLRERRLPRFDPDRWNARGSWSSVAYLTQALLSLGDDAAAAALVTGIDTAGDEAAMPNWPFLLAYERLEQERPGAFSFSIHAGESFGHALEGLRRIAECLLSANVAAIGHGLALDEQASVLVSGDVWTSPKIGTALMDLCWCWSAGVSAHMALPLIDEILLVSGLRGYGASAADYCAAWTSLHSPTGVFDLGLGERDPFWIPDYADLGDVAALPGIAAAARLLTYRPPGKQLDALDRRLQGPTGLRFREFAISVEAEARALVRRLVRERDIVVEVCPTSNMRLAGMPSLHSSHLARLRAHGIRVSISSDDPVVFGTSVGREYDLTESCFGAVTAEEVARASVQSCSAPQMPWTADSLAASVGAGVDY